MDGVARPAAAVASDCDADGVDDLVAVYQAPGGGLLAIYKGLAHGLAVEPSLAELPVAPDFVAAGDFTSSGQTDLVVASHTDSAIWLLRGDGHGQFADAERIELPGVVTALESGEFGRHDGRMDLAVGVDGASGASTVVFASRDGALMADPVTVPLDSPAVSLAFGQFDASSPIDLAIASGAELLIVHGERNQVAGATPQIDQRPLSSKAVSICPMLVNGHLAQSIASLGADGSVRVLAPSGPADAPGALTSWDERIVSSEAWPGAERMLAAHVTGSATCDLVVVDSGAGALRLLSQPAGDSYKNDADRSVATIDSHVSAVAVVAMRLNGDALADIVAFDSAHVAPVQKISSPQSTFTVTSTADTLTAGTLRQAITDANATVGADTITFNLSGPGTTIAVLTPLPAITESVTIDGATQPGFDGAPIVALDGTATAVGVNGLSVTAGGSVTIRGLVINNFKGSGILLDTVANNVVEGCYIGTSASGTADQGNAGDGITISTSASNTIGGAGDALNIISGNDASGVRISGLISVGNSILRNRIGTNAAGSASVPNNGNGILIELGGSNNTIGGASALVGNLISGNGVSGVNITGAASDSNLIRNNQIGTMSDGVTGIPNNLNGVLIGGDDSTLTGNRIAFNSGAGIVCGSAGTGNTFSANSIDVNGALGIDLLPVGATPNDAGDADTGPNGLQNFPVLTSASVVGSTTTVDGTFNSKASTQYRIEFFSIASCDASGFGEGSSYLGFVAVTTNASGNAIISATLNVAVAGSAAVTATATDPSGSTSEFSACITAATTAQVSVTQVSAPNPVPSGNQLTYAIAIHNDGPLPAENVTLLGSTPSGTTFNSVSAPVGTFTSPAPGGVGAISGTFGTMATDSTIVVTFKVLVIGPPGQSIVNTVFAGSTTPDPKTEDNTSTNSTNVISPPVITSITKLVVSGKPFKIKITGANLQPGVLVFIGPSRDPYSDVKYKDSTMLILRKGNSLKALFPKDVPVAIGVLNPDGGTASSTFTR